MIGAAISISEISGWRVEQVADPQSVARVADAVAEQRQAPEAGALGVGVDLVQPQAETSAEVVGPEVVEPGPRRRPPSSTASTVRSTGWRSPWSSARRWTSVSSGLAQVGDADTSGRHPCTEKPPSTGIVWPVT